MVMRETFITQLNRTRNTNWMDSREKESGAGNQEWMGVGGGRMKGEMVGWPVGWVGVVNWAGGWDNGYVNGYGYGYVK